MFLFGLAIKVHGVVELGVPPSQTYQNNQTMLCGVYWPGRQASRKRQSVKPSPPDERRKRPGIDSAKAEACEAIEPVWRPFSPSWRESWF
jgi:hypothetical protein